MNQEEVREMQATVVEMLDQLKTVRELNDGLKAERTKMMDEFTARPEYRALDEATKEAKITADKLIEGIQARVLILEDVEADMPARVKIKYFDKVVIVDEQATLQWAIENFRLALDLNVGIIEAAMQKFPERVPERLAYIFKEPRAQIDTKL